MGDIVSLIVIIIVLFAIGAFLLYFSMFLMSFLDNLWLAIFKRPIYIHLYLFPKKISEYEQFILRQKFIFYKKLSDKQKKYFQHRLAFFNKTYQFIPRGDFQMNKESQILIGATYVMLTFGMLNI